MTIADIHSTPLRRAALVVAFPIITLRHVAWPLRVLLAAVRDATLAFSEALRDEWDSPDARLLRRGLALIWHEQYHTDREQALNDVTRKPSTTPKPGKPGGSPSSRSNA